MALAHNGNLSKCLFPAQPVGTHRRHLPHTSDTEIIAYLVTRERLSSPSIEEAVSRAMDTLEGAYSLCLMSAAKLIALRDPYGFRPLCYGICPDGTYVVASESCALTAVGAKLERDLLPGEILVFSQDGVVSRREHCGKKPKKLCVFELHLLCPPRFRYRWGQCPKRP